MSTANTAIVDEIVASALSRAGLGTLSNCSPVVRERCAAAGAKAASAVLESHLPVDDADSVYKAEYARQRSAYLEAGMSEDDYVNERKIDDGILSLPFGSAQAAEKSAAEITSGKYVGICAKFPTGDEVGAEIK